MKVPNKIVLIRPPEINRVWAGIPKFFNDGIFLFPPLGIMQLKAYIEEYTAYEVIIYDSLIYKADYKKIAEFVKKTSPRMVGISAFTHSLADVIETAREVKKINPEVFITIGGPHTYAFPEESAYLLNSGHIDYIILGDGEEGLKNLLDALDKDIDFSKLSGIIYKDKYGEIKKNGEPQFIENLDSLPLVSHDINGFKHYYTPASSGCTMTTIITSRGCPYKCKFCNVQKRYRSRSVKSIVDEIELCSKNGFKEIFFVDDTFNASVKRVIDISKEILVRRLRIKWGFKARCDNVNSEMLKIAKLAGCFRIHYGVETGLAEGLSSVNKKVTLEEIEFAFNETKKFGIRSTAYFMIGCPHEKCISDIVSSINFACSLRADFAVFSLFSPYSDTAFYKEGVEKNIIDPAAWNEFIKNPHSGHNLPTYWEEYFSKADLIRFLILAHRRFYYRPRIIFNALLGILSFKEFARLFNGLVSLVKLESLYIHKRSF